MPAQAQSDHREEEGGVVLAANWPQLEHDPEKWNPVFRKDHAQTKS
jgi:hypothetical protein